VARFGSDKTIIGRRFGPKVFPMRVYSHADTMTTAQRIADAAELEPDDEIAVDEVGVGAGVFDRPKTLLPGRRLYGVNVGQQAFRPEKYANLGRRSTGRCGTDLSPATSTSRRCRPTNSMC
jgi:hypothetical protein